MNESKVLLESERKLRLKLEEQIHALEAQLQLQIDVPEVDNSEEITAHILGRKPNLPQKMFKVIHYALDYIIIFFNSEFKLLLPSSRTPMTKIPI